MHILWDPNLNYYSMGLIFITKRSITNKKSNSTDSSNNNNSELDPWYVTGLVDGDGSFWFSIVPNNAMKIGFEIRPGFSFSAANNPANFKLMLLLDTFFNHVGTILVLNHTNMLEYKVQGLKNCLIIKSHFLTYPLLTYKLVYFTMWCNMLDIIETKLHLTNTGLIRLLEIKSAFTKGLTPILKDKFPSIQSVALPSYLPNLININYFWLAPPGRVYYLWRFLSFFYKSRNNSYYQYSTRYKKHYFDECYSRIFRIW